MSTEVIRLSEGARHPQRHEEGLAKQYLLACFASQDIESTSVFQ